MATDHGAGDDVADHDLEEPLHSYSGAIERQRLIDELVANEYTISDRGVWSCLSTKALRSNVTRCRFLSRRRQYGGGADDD